MIKNEALIEDLNLIAHTDKKSPLAEAYRTIRTNIQFSQTAQGGLKVIMLSSPTPNEGKSSTIANLGVVMAQAGHKTLVIDADLRNSTQHKIFKLHNKGVTNVIAAGMAVNEAIQATEIENLFVLPAGPVAPNPSEMLNSQAALQLVLDLKPSYDYILIDTPPILPVTDACVVAGKADGTILLVESGAVGVEPVKDAQKRLQQAGAKILGVVLNKVEVAGGKYGYGKGYGYGYGYGYYYYYGEDGEKHHKEKK